MRLADGCDGCIDPDDGFNLGLSWLTGYEGPSGASDPGVFGRMQADARYAAFNSYSQADFYASVGTAAIHRSASNVGTPYAEGAQA